MSLLVFALIVVLVVAAICWIIQLVPFPPGAPAWLKQALMTVIVLIGLIVILIRLPAGVLSP